MRKIFLSVLSIILAVNVLTAQSNISGSVDSLWIEIAEKNTPIIQHRLLKGETLYQLKSRYRVSIEDILKVNDFQDVSDIPDSTLVKIPVEKILEGIDLLHDIDENDGFRMFYKVKPKETVFRVARRYFDISIDEVKSRNGLDSDQLSIGQVLYIGTIPKAFTSIGAVEPLPADHHFNDSLKTDSSAVDITEIKSSPFDIYESQGQKIYNSKGVAIWDRNKAVGKHQFVLHKTARPNSILEIRNPMNGRIVCAKVVGTIPAKSHTEDINLVVSPAVAKALGVLDARFYVTFKYIQ